MLSGHAVAVIVLTCLLGRTALDEYLSSEVINDLGNLLLTFVIVWAYMVYFDYMLAWIANVQHETTWFIPRTTGVWGGVAVALVVTHLAIPFFVLLSRDVKRSPRALTAVAILVLGSHLVFWWLQVLPAFPSFGGWFWLNAATVIGVGGIWLADFLWELGRYPMLPVHDPSAASALQLRHDAEEELDAEEDLAHA